MDQHEFMHLMGLVTFSIAECRGARRAPINFLSFFCNIGRQKMAMGPHP
jgi:hypothetical protein